MWGDFQYASGLSKCYGSVGCESPVSSVAGLVPAPGPHYCELFVTFPYLWVAAPIIIIMFVPFVYWTSFLLHVTLRHDCRIHDLSYNEMKKDTSRDF